MSEMTDVLIEENAEGIMTLTLDRPESYNAINPELRAALLDGLRRAEAERARCIVLRGAGRGFCAGIDLKTGGNGLTGFELVDYMRASSQSIVRAVLGSPIPIVTAVHGVCARSASVRG